MEILNFSQFDPLVRVANYIEQAPGTTHGPRVIPDPELIFHFRGRFRYEDAEGNSLTLKPGELLMIPPDMEHTYSYPVSRTRPGSIACIHCELTHWGHWGRHYRIEITPPRVTAIPKESPLHSLFMQAARNFNAAGPYRRELTQTLVKAIWLELMEIWAAQDSISQIRLSVRMEEMLHFLQENMSRPVSRADLAKRFNLTPQYINALFKKEVGQAPTAWLNEQRCRRAAELMRLQKLSVTQAAEAVGFSDAFYFSKVFRKVMGSPPSQVKE